MNRQKDSGKISLGFTEERFHRGVHICQIFYNDQEREDALFKFIISGLLSNDRCAVFSDKTTIDIAQEILYGHGIFINSPKFEDAISFNSAKDLYFHNDIFAPDVMLNRLESSYLESCNLNFKGLRAIGEISNQILTTAGGERLLEYESRINVMLEQYPITVVCQYDANIFSGKFLMDILKVHPLMLMRGSIISNPFYIQARSFLKESTNYHCCSGANR